jgi:hypothetical protein
MKTWTQKIVFAFILSAGLSASAQSFDLADHTEDAEVVCQMDDFVATKLYVDWDEDLNAPTGKNSTKVIEVPTQNVFGQSNLLYKVEVIKVEYPSCADCEASQVIYYKSQFTKDLISKLEVSSTQATLTVDVDLKGKPQKYAVVSKGSCKLNEVE